jgi:hypothetical protein
MWARIYQAEEEESVNLLRETPEQHHPIRPHMLTVMPAEESSNHVLHRLGGQPLHQSAQSVFGLAEVRVALH